MLLLVAALAMLPPHASAQYANPQYIQAAPNYVTYPQAKPSPYGYPAQSTNNILSSLSNMRPSRSRLRSPLPPSSLSSS